MAMNTSIGPCVHSRSKVDGMYLLDPPPHHLAKCNVQWIFVEVLSVLGAGELDDERVGCQILRCIVSVNPAPTVDLLNVSCSYHWQARERAGGACLGGADSSFYRENISFVVGWAPARVLQSNKG